MRDESQTLSAPVLHQMNLLSNRLDLKHVKSITMEVSLGRFEGKKISVCICVYLWLQPFLAAFAPREKV